MDITRRLGECKPMNLQQKIGLLRSLGKLASAIVDGAAIAKEHEERTKLANQPLTGLPLPRTIVQRKPGCNVCDGKKR